MKSCCLSALSLGGSSRGRAAREEASGPSSGRFDHQARLDHVEKRFPARPVHGTAAGRSATLGECRKEASSWQNAAYRSYGPNCRTPPPTSVLLPEASCFNAPNTGASAWFSLVTWSLTARRSSNCAGGSVDAGGLWADSTKFQYGST